MVQKPDLLPPPGPPPPPPLHEGNGNGYSYGGGVQRPNMEPPAPPSHGNMNPNANTNIPTLQRGLPRHQMDQPTGKPGQAPPPRPDRPPDFSDGNTKDQRTRYWSDSTMYRNTILHADPPEKQFNSKQQPAEWPREKQDESPMNYTPFKTLPRPPRTPQPQNENSNNLPHPPQGNPRRTPQPAADILNNSFANNLEANEFVPAQNLPKPSIMETEQKSGEEAVSKGRVPSRTSSLYSGISIYNTRRMSESSIQPVMFQPIQPAWSNTMLWGRNPYPGDPMMYRPYSSAQHPLEGADQPTQIPRVQNRPSSEMGMRSSAFVTATLPRKMPTQDPPRHPPPKTPQQQQQQLQQQQLQQLQQNGAIYGYNMNGKLQQAQFLEQRQLGQRNHVPVQMQGEQRMESSSNNMEKIPNGMVRDPSAGRTRQNGTPQSNRMMGYNNQHPQGMVGRKDINGTLARHLSHDQLREIPIYQIQPELLPSTTRNSPPKEKHREEHSQNIGNNAKDSGKELLVPGPSPTSSEPLEKVVKRVEGGGRRELLNMSTIIRLAGLQIVIGVILFALGLVRLITLSAWGLGIEMVFGVYVVLCGVLGVLGGRKKHYCSLIAHFVMSTLATCLAIPPFVAALMVTVPESFTNIGDEARKFFTTDNGLYGVDVFLATVCMVEVVLGIITAAMGCVLGGNLLQKSVEMESTSIMGPKGIREREISTVFTPNLYNNQKI